MNKIYLVEYYDRKSVSTSEVVVEDAEPVGYFSGKKQAEDAIKQCVSAHIPRKQLRMVEYPLRLSNAQTNVYVLMYEYYCEEEGGKAEYYYTFPPCKSEFDCEQLRLSLSDTLAYCKTPEKHFYESVDGFRVERFVLNECRPVAAFE